MTQLAAVVGLMILDPRPEPLARKSFVAIWNSFNLMTTIGDFIALTRPTR